MNSVVGVGEVEGNGLTKLIKETRADDGGKPRAQEAEQGEQLLSTEREERNPGSEGHPDNCKKPCNKYIREKPSSCKHGDECGYCHENHNKPKHKGQRGRYAQQRREFLESQNNDEAFASNINRIYKEVHEECDNLKRWLLHWKQVSEGTMLNRVLDELRLLGEAAQKARPDRSRMQSTKAASVSSSQTLNLSDVEGRCKWLIGTMHLMVRKRWEELGQVDEEKRPAKQQAVEEEVSRLLKQLHDLGHKVEKHDWEPEMTPEELLQLIQEMFPEQTSSSSSSSSKGQLVTGGLREIIEKKATELTKDLPIFEYEPLKEYLQGVSETRAAADFIDRLDFCLEAVKKKDKAAEEKEKAKPAEVAEEAQAEEAQAEAQAEEVQADEAPRVIPYAKKIEAIMEDKLGELEAAYRETKNVKIHIQNEYVINLLPTKREQLFPSQGGLYREFNTEDLTAFINEADCLVDLDKRFEWCRKLLVDDFMDGAEDSGDEEAERFVDLQHQEYNKREQQERQQKFIAAQQFQ